MEGEPEREREDYAAVKTCVIMCATFLYSHISKLYKHNMSPSLKTLLVFRISHIQLLLPCYGHGVKVDVGI